MYDIRSNPFENSILFLMKGQINMVEVKTMSDKLTKEARRLQPGFVLVTDIRELSPLPEDVRLFYQETLQTVRKIGLAAEIRMISPTNPVTANQIQRTSRAAGYTAKEATSRIEVDRFLDSL